MITDHGYSNENELFRRDRCTVIIDIPSMKECRGKESDHTMIPIPEPTFSTAVVRTADAQQYTREPIPEEGRQAIRVTLLNATPDPLGSIAALCGIYEGRVVRSLGELTDNDRRTAFSNMMSTVLSGPLEGASFHFLIEGLDRAMTHQMVRSRTSFFAQESLRFAVPEGDWAEEVALPPWLLGTSGQEAPGAERSPGEYARNMWEASMRDVQRTYQGLIDQGMPAEEARGILPHAMPTRIHWVTNLRTLLQEAGKRTCTQAQHNWRIIFGGIVQSLREYRAEPREVDGVFVTEPDGWQFELIAGHMAPVCYQTGSCGFMAKFDRDCSIRARVDANADIGRSSSEWGTEHDTVEGNPIAGGVGPRSVVRDEKNRPVFIGAIRPAEWAADPSAARRAQ